LQQNTILMARTESNMLPLGKLAPEFSLPDTVTGKTLNLQQLKGDKATVIMFICNHCPFVKHVNAQLVALANDYKGKGVGFIAISSNDVENYPDDSPEKMKENAAEQGFTFPYLYDETQEVAKAYDAACTPDFYVFDHGLKLSYRGQLDDSRPGNNLPVTGSDLRNALTALLENKEVSAAQKPSIGCNIKWKK
jgi:peroxiredoxin